jgi:hypothetical protein
LLREALIGNALVEFSVHQHARRESISKRAPSTTRPSLRFRINELRPVPDSLAQNLDAVVEPRLKIERRTPLALKHRLRRLRDPEDVTRYAAFTVDAPNQNPSANGAFTCALVSADAVV